MAAKSPHPEIYIFKRTTKMTSEISPLRHLRTLALCLAAAVTLTVGTLSAQSQTSSPKAPSDVSITPSANEASETHPWTIEQLIPLTVSEAWARSGKNEDKFFDMVQDLAAFSAQKRGLVLPENEATGRRAGELIKRAAAADRGQLLYAVVDQAVRRVGTKATATK
jgi:hypothetical protein